MTPTLLMQLKGNEQMVQATCAPCWARGLRAVAYLPPKVPFPPQMTCPFCGVTRTLAEPSPRRS